MLARTDANLTYYLLGFTEQSHSLGPAPSQFIHAQKILE